MRTRQTIILAALLSLAGLCVGCGGTPQVKYHAGDRNAVAGQVEEWTFDKDTVGKPPAGAEVFGGTWEVKAEPDAPSPPHVLGQSATAEFPAIRFGEKVYADLVATV